MLFFRHELGNRFLTFLSNTLTDLNLTDMETCYKAFRADILRRIPLRSNRFGLEPELTAKVARLRVPLYEVGVSYYGRTYAEGKKITWRDGLKAIAGSGRRSTVTPALRCSSDVSGSAGSGRGWST